MKEMKYCTNCNLHYELQSRKSCVQCGSEKYSFYKVDNRSDDLIRFFANRKMKEYTQKNQGTI